MTSPTTNPFACGFDEDSIPLDVLQAMGRLQVESFDNFIEVMRVACATNVYNTSHEKLKDTANLQSSTPTYLPLHHGGTSKCDRDDRLFNALKIDLPTFCGRSDSCPADVFLQQVQRYARAAHHTNQWLLIEVMPVVLVGDAEQWWAGRGGYAIWSTFQVDFLRAFGQPDRARRLRQELDARTQHPEEDFGSFVRVIAAYYERLGSQETEEEKIERVLSQSTPFCRQMLWGRNFKSLTELENVGPEIQELVWRNQNYKPPPLPYNTMEQDLAFQPVFVSPPPTVAVTGQSDKCNRCGGIGHWARQCATPQPILDAGPTTSTVLSKNSQQ